LEKQRRSFTTEFKREAAELVTRQGYTVKQLRQERIGIVPQSKALTPEQQKIKELEARIDRLEREKVILKKATALLMAEQLGHTS